MAHPQYSSPMTPIHGLLPQQSQRELFHYQNVQLFRHETLGTGSYGAVCKAKCDELPCAAKVLHSALFQFNDPGVNAIARRFEQECEILCALRHPHIVQFIGTYRDPDSHQTVLLMEILEESLTHFLESSEERLQYHLQVNLCHDIILAISYLHSNGIIHRDMSSNNVLLTESKRAKVTDFGMSTLLDVNPRMSQRTQCPGTMSYMAPEALHHTAHYTQALDIFSVGVLCIQIITRLFPDPGPSSRMVEDPRSPTGTIHIPCIEAERRRDHIELIEPDHPLLSIAHDCLKYREGDRPTAVQICNRLEVLKQSPQYTGSVEQAREHPSSLQRSLSSERELRIREQEDQIRELRQQLEQRCTGSEASSLIDNQQALIPQPALMAASYEMLADFLTRPQPKPRQQRDKATPVDSFFEVSSPDPTPLISFPVYSAGDIIHPPPLPPPPLPPTPPLVAQMMEMGFIRERVQLAIEATGSDSPQQLINWLLDNAEPSPTRCQPPPSCLPPSQPPHPCLPLSQPPHPCLPPSQPPHPCLPPSQPPHACLPPSQPPHACLPPSQPPRPCLPPFPRPRQISNLSREALPHPSSPHLNQHTSWGIQRIDGSPPPHSSSSEDSDESDDTSDESDEGEQQFKIRTSFINVDDYAHYVRDNVAVGMMVQCCEASNVVQKEDVGDITEVGLPSLSLHDLSMEVKWHRSGSCYWVRFAQCELLSGIDALRPGDSVRVKRSEFKSMYKLGDKVTHKNVGKVLSISADREEVCVEFPKGTWIALKSQLEIVPSVHKQKCSGCGLRPIKGPRFHCKVCKFFNFCRKCFLRGRSHTHHDFQRINSNGQQGFSVGRPKSKCKEKKKERCRRKQPGDQLWRDFVLVNVEEAQEEGIPQQARLPHELRRTTPPSSNPTPHPLQPSQAQTAYLPLPPQSRRHDYENVKPLPRRSSSPALFQELPMQYAPPFQATTLPPQNSHVTAVPASHWSQRPPAQPYDSHAADVDYHQAPGNSTHRRGSLTAVFSGCQLGTATPQMPTPRYAPHPPRPLRPSAAGPLLTPIHEQEEEYSLPPNSAPTSDTRRREYNPAYMYSTLVPHKQDTASNKLARYLPLQHLQQAMPPVSGQYTPTDVQQGIVAEYTAALYQPQQIEDPNKPWRVVWTVCRRNPSCATALRNYLLDVFGGEFWTSSFCIHFMGTEVRLTIPEDGARDQGYTIVPNMHPCMITKSEADPPSHDFGANADDTYPPRIVLDVNPLGVPKRVELNCLLEVTGIEEQGRSFRLRSPNVTLHRVARRTAGQAKDKKGHCELDAERQLDFSDDQGILNTEPDFKMLMDKVVARMPAQWEQVGYALGTPPEQIERIKEEMRGCTDAQAAFRQVLLIWKRQTLDERKRTWSEIIRALESPQVGQNYWANRIKRELLDCRR